MNNSVEELLELAPYQFKSESELLNSIHDLINSFNVNRDLITDNYQSDRFISAYLVYFFSTNFEKLKACFDRLDQSLIKSLSETSLIDFGSGPGTTTFSWLDYFKDYSKSISLVDTSKLMLDLALEISKKYYSSATLKFSASLPHLSEESTLYFSHSLNEINPEFISRILESDKLKHVVVLEPGTKQSFKKVILLRDLLFEHGFEVEYPCSISSTCPIRNMDDWCHQYIYLRFDSSIERLCQKLRKDRKNAPVIFQVYTKGKRLSKIDSKIFRALPEKKYGLEYIVCEKNKLIEKKITKKEMRESPFSKKDFKSKLIAGESALIKWDAT